MAAPYKVVIDGQEYDAETWETVQQGEALRESWSEGWVGGMGELKRRSPDGHYITIGFDGSSYPYLRLPPTRAAEITLANLDTSLPLYHFQAKDASANEYLYVLNGQYSFKINRSTNLLIETKDFGGGQAGRPATFEGTPQVALGDSVDAYVLTTCAVGTGDTWTAKTGVKALAFAIVQDEGTAKLARAHTTNLVDLSADGTDWTGDDFEAGDSSLPITDLLVSSGDIVVIRPDGPRRFDTLGNSLPIQEYVGKTSDSSATDGANSFAHGPYTYWPHSSGLGRIIGESIDWIGPEANPRWGFRPGLSLSPEPFATGQWNAAAAHGRWFYGVHRAELCFGYILGNGKVLWHGVIDQGGSSAVGRCFLDDGPSLWYNFDDTTTLIRLDLESDGSMRAPLGEGRGEASTTYSAYLSEFDKQPDKQKHLSRIWVITEGFPLDSSASLSLGYHRDGKALQKVGGAITQSGTFERNPSLSPRSLFYRLIPRLQLITTAQYDSDLVEIIWIN